VFFLPAGSSVTPEESSRQEIDRQLAQCGWVIQSRNEMNISAAAGIAIREFPMLTGEADDLLYLDTHYGAAVQANVLFFDAKPAREKPWTEKLWVFDYRTNIHHTLKTKPLKR
jgi:hypothetical protein